MIASPADDGGDPSGRAVAEGVYRFGTRRINWYVLETGDSLTVVDAGLPAHRPQLTKWLGDNGYEFADIAAVVLTHADVDHVGLAKPLADQGVPVYCHPADFPLLRSHPQGPPRWYLRSLWRPRFVGYALEMLRAGVRSVEPLTGVEPLSDGDVLPVASELRVIHAPGHTPGSCALYAEDRAVLFCGDALATRNIFTQREGEPQLLGSADEDHEEAKASLERLDGLGSVTVLPGHGNPWDGDIETAIALAR
ncbi:MBL fold metallo-hydrolase [Halobaculum roseum]|uniref:MBL fold metallo-hydrolase n=1 Tax=Halobaculum roseum TaxID=2175149 RepID=A0ABD5MVJ5_9EURY|nr:MBL fold metallo-hydrolase [Halobaculum roseum]QZY04587.1 MBL fold metallo-hydrolase [Halobaculum roseum]